MFPFIIPSCLICNYGDSLVFISPCLLLLRMTLLSNCVRREEVRKKAKEQQDKKLHFRTGYLTLFRGRDTSYKTVRYSKAQYGRYSVDKEVLPLI